LALVFRPASGPSSRRRATFLTRAEIIGAAAALVERDGYDALNMRAVAAELGVRAAALYRYVESREELEDLLFDHLMADCAPTLRGEDWREDLLAVASAWRERLVSRRDATRIALGQVSIGANLAPLMDVALSVLGRSGLGETDLIEAYQACLIFVHGFAANEASHRDVAARAGARIAPLRPEWVQTYPSLTAVFDRLSEPMDFDAHFAFGMEALIAGIERRAAMRSGE
jgi:TetR/AcrR family tetracycline transcriptional repressor